MNYTQKVLSGLALVSAVALLFSACRKINDATDVGDGLIPPIDNITTFETFLDIESDNRAYLDSNKVYYGDEHALGYIGNDPEFGATNGESYFTISHANYMIYPFLNKDSVLAIDSVILSLSYSGYYGDSNSTQTLRVYEIAQNAGFNDTTVYKYSHPAFATTGPELGSKTYQVYKLKDSVLHIRKRDTTKVANIIRIPISNQFGERLKGYDTTNTANGGYRNDSIFKTLFRGFAVRPDATGNAVVFINASDNQKTKLTVYYQVKRNGSIDTTSVDFFHSTGGEANLINRTPGGGWAGYLANSIPNDDLLYINSAPGSAAWLRIPALDTFRNVVVHRAEIIANPIRSSQDEQFIQPGALFLDRIHATGDTASTFDADMSVGNNFTNFTYDFASFGGGLKTDSTYRFNISRYVQQIVTNRATNYRLRLYAPVRTFLFSPIYGETNQLYVNQSPVAGRVVLAGGSYVNPAKRIRLRLVYSRL